MLVVSVICLLIAFGTYIWLYAADVNKSLCQNVMIVIILISTAGNISRYLCTTLEAAILAQKVLYLGGAFVPVLYFFSVCAICQVNLKKYAVMLMVSGQMLLYMAICTIGYSTIYYKSIDFVVSETGLPVFVKEYGPLHTVYPLTLVGYLLASVLVAIFTEVKKNTVNRLEIAIMLTSAVLSVVSYNIKYLLPVDVDISPVAYMFLMLGAVIPMYHADLYNSSTNKDIVKSAFTSVGFVTFGKKLEYMGSNELATQVLPELVHLQIGKRIENPGEEVLKLQNCIEKYKNDPEFLMDNIYRGEAVKIGDRTFDIFIHKIKNCIGTHVGYTVEIDDETEHYRVIELTNRYNEQLTNDVNEKTQFIRTIQDKTLLGMALMVESRDLNTGGHVKRTSDVIRIFAKRLLSSELGFSRKFLRNVIRSAPMHDIGKIGVDDAILRKQGKYTEEEYEIMKKHSAIGAKMIDDILTGVDDDEFVRIAKNVAHYHHERVNGKGYPCGLSGEDIPVEARIMALADVFDALVSKRCYKEAFSYDEAFEIIKKDSGTHFDAELAKVFIECRPELEEYYNNCDNK